MRLLICSESKGAIFASIPLCEPEILCLLVFGEVVGGNDVSDFFAIGREVGLIDVAESSVIFEFQRAFGICA